ncbi:hypothetical protein FM112_06260 [Gulosibacter sp. 10]|nr:hypothetical protein FM112_06260 [Gulosibacter sp. 10]
MAVAGTLLASALVLAGCSGTGPGDESAEPEAPETEAAEPTAEAEEDQAAQDQDVNVVVIAADYDEASGAIEVRSIVTDHIGEGVCTITATSPDGEDSVETTVDAVPDAQSTVCPTTLLEGAGPEWDVVVSFSDDALAGASEAFTAETI